MISTRKLILYLIAILLSISCLLACSKPQTIEQVTIEVEVTKLVEIQEIVEVEVTRQVPIVVTRLITPTPAPTPAFTQSYPSLFRRDYSNIDCDNALTMLDINACAYNRAYASARELDDFLMELDQQYPNKSWQSPMMIGSAFMSQEDWESHKESYCRLDVQGNYGGSIYPLMLFECIERENFSRLGTLKYLACTFLENFSWDCDG